MKHNLLFKALLALVICPCMLAAETWFDIFRKYEHLISRHPIIRKQFNAFNSGKVPSIASSAIKRISIIETNEELVDIKLTNDSRVAMLTKPSDCTTPCCSGSGRAASSLIRRSLYEKLLVMADGLDIFAEEFGYSAGQLCIKVYEGLRTPKTQLLLFDLTVKAISIKYPTWPNAKVETEASKWVSPVKDNTPAHTTGGAVDIRLWDKKANKLVDFGSFGAVGRINQEAPTFSTKITDLQKYNRLLCLLAASYAGLINYPNEFWHFSYGDCYAIYWMRDVTLTANYGMCLE